MWYYLFVNGNCEVTSGMIELLENLIPEKYPNGIVIGSENLYNPSDIYLDEDKNICEKFYPPSSPRVKDYDSIDPAVLDMAEAVIDLGARIENLERGAV